MLLSFIFVLDNFSIWPIFFFKIIFGFFEKSHFSVNFDCRAMRFSALEAEDLPLQDGVGKF